MAAGVFSIFGAQPLVISGVTGSLLSSFTLPSRSLRSPRTLLRLRSYHGLQQDHFQHHRWPRNRTRLPAVHRLGLPLGRDLALGVRSLARLQIPQIRDEVLVRYVRILRFVSPALLPQERARIRRRREDAERREEE